MCALVIIMIAAPARSNNTRGASSDIDGRAISIIMYQIIIHENRSSNNIYI